LVITESGKAMNTQAMDDLDAKLGKSEHKNRVERERYRRIRNWAISELGGECFYCHGKEDLEIHDIEPVYEGHGKRRGGTTIKRWRTLIPLGKMRLACHECHISIEHSNNTNALKKVGKAHA